MDRPAAGDDLSLLRRRAAGLATLVEVSGKLAATLDLDEVLRATTDGVCRLAGFDTAAVYLVEGPLLRIGGATPPLPPAFPEPLRLALLAEHPHIRRALESGVPVLVPDARAVALTPAERTAVDQRGLRTLLYCPMIAGVKPVGVLIVSDSGDPRSVAPDDVDLCRTLANLAAVAAENARLFRAERERAAAQERQAAEARRADAERLELERRLLHAQKLESLGLLAGGVAHDFNNLLQAMLGNLDLALPELAPGSTARDAVAQAAQAARRATDLTRQLLAYSGRGRFVVRPLDLSALVRENAELFRASVPRTCAIALELAPALPPVEADAGQVQQVIMNLLTNAADAIGDAPGKISIRTGLRAGGPAALEGSRVEGVAPADAYVALEVVDTGCGMDADTLVRLFDPFFSTKGVGRGLGMAALLGIMRGHRGGILVDSSPGRGARVCVLFPARPNARPPAPAQVPVTADVPPAAGAALVVDDEPAVRRACLSMLRKLQMPAFAAGGGAEAVEVLRLRRGEIRFAVIDLSMDGMDGVATMEALLEVDPSVRVILSSGFDEQAVLARTAPARIAGFLQKPYTMAELRESLRRAAGTPGGTAGDR